MIARVSSMIAKPVQIQQARYRPQPLQLPVRPLVQPFLQIPVSLSCIPALASIMTSICLIQMTVSRKVTVICQ